MEFIKHFKVLNQVIGYYSLNPISSQSIDRHLTIQIITQTSIDVSALGLHKSQMAIINRIMGIKKLQNSNKKQVTQINKTQQQLKGTQQSNLSTQQTLCQNASYLQQNQFTLFIIHEYGYPNGHYISFQYPLLKRIMNSVDNLIVIDGFGHMWNNFIHYQYLNLKKISDLNQNRYDESHKIQKKSRPFLIISPNQSKKIKIIDNESDKYFISQLQSYLQICNIYQGHLNLRVISYKQKGNSYLQKFNTIQKIRYFIDTINAYSNSEDDLDVLLRNEVPDNAFMKVCQQCANRITENFIKLSQNFRIINLQTNRYYVARLISNQQRDNKIIKENLIKPTDQLIIWVLIDGKPSLSLLPLFDGNKIRKKHKLSTNNDKFLQIRSCLGYTKFQMEEKICSKSHKNKFNFSKKKNQAKKEQFNSENDSMEGNDSQLSNLSVYSFQECWEEKPEINICIINILDKKMPQPQMQQIIQRQMKEIMKKFISERKDIYHNLIIQKNMAMISRVSQLLRVEEKEVQHVVFLNKL